MKIISEIRRENVRSIMSSRTQSKKDFAGDLEISPSQLTHIAGANPKRNIGDDQAREIERRLGLDIGWLDNIHISKDMDNFIDRVMHLNKDGIEFMAAQLEVAETIISKKSYQEFAKGVDDKRVKDVPVKLNRRNPVPKTEQEHYAQNETEETKKGNQ
ncbi:MAG: hypothetical protein ACYC4K_10410 [Thiobacillus sp.]